MFWPLIFNQIQSSGEMTDFSLVTYAGLFPIILVRLLPFITINLKLTFRCASVQSTTDGPNQVPDLQCFFFFDNLFNLDGSRNKKEKIPLFFH